MANSSDMRSATSPVQGSLISSAPLSNVSARLALPANQSVTIMGIRVPTALVDGEEEAVRYHKMTQCEGYCKDLLMRKVAILCALDNV